MTVTIEFRPARIDEGDGLVLASAMAAEIYEMYEGLDLSSPDMPKAGPTELGPPAGRFLVGYGADGTPLCCGGFKRLSDRVCEIKRMYVVPAARGQGAARRLLGVLEDAARELGYAVVRLDTGPKQRAARRLYESAGYRAVENFNAHPVATYFGEKLLR